ncbi:MAG: DUF1475 family protein [Pseudomonadota bacterium]
MILRPLVFFAAAALLASFAWAWGLDDRGLGPVLSEMVSKPWTVVTLIDLYLGFLLCAIVVFLFERNKLVAIAWCVPIFILGNVWTAAWFLIRLPELARRLRG